MHKDTGSIYTRQELQESEENVVDQEQVTWREISAREARIKEKEKVGGGGEGRWQWKRGMLAK